jgi:hypothetical protein
VEACMTICDSLYPHLLAANPWGVLGLVSLIVDSTARHWCF